MAGVVTRLWCGWYLFWGGRALLPNQLWGPSCLLHSECCGRVAGVWS